MSARTIGVVTLALLFATNAPAAHAQQPPPGPPLRGSWTSDRLGLQEGDLITILIDELTLASADRNERNSQQRSRDLSVAAGSGGAPSGGSLRTGNDVSDRRRGESSRRERFSAEISARVVELFPSGVARIEGVKKVKIDEHEQQVTIRGYIRTQDLSIANTIESWRIAQAEILYDSNDNLGKAGGIWSKLLNLIIP